MDLFTESEMAQKIAWIMCRMANGGGPGKCNPEYCVCGEEGRQIAKALYAEGYALHKEAFRKDAKSNV